MTHSSTSMQDGYYVGPKGELLKPSMVSDMDKLIDNTVNSIFDYGFDLMEQIARFRGHTFDDVDCLMSLLAEKYGTTRGGKKGNVSFISHDGLRRVAIRIDDYIEFGPELQIAKGLVDEYVKEVGQGAPDELMALLNSAFAVDKEGKVNRNDLQRMRRWPIEHPTWVRAMNAVTDSMRVVASKERVEISSRESTRDNFKSLPANLANAWLADTVAPVTKEMVDG